MKKNELALLILIISISGLIAFFIGKAIFGGQVSKPVEVQTIERISTEIVDPSSSIFNENAINPTVPITIGGGEASTPFEN